MQAFPFFCKGGGVDNWHEDIQLGGLDFGLTSVFPCNEEHLQEHQM